MAKKIKEKQADTKASDADQKMADLAGKLKTGAEPADKKPPPAAKKAKPKPERKAVHMMNRNELRKEVSRLRKAEDKYEAEMEALAAVGIRPEGEVPEVPPEAYGAFASMIFDYLASRFGEHWRLSQPELKAYGQALEAVARRYLPEASATHPELVGLGIVAVTTMAPRVYVTWTIKKEKEKYEEKEDRTVVTEGHA